MPAGSLPPRDKVDQRFATYKKVLYDPVSTPTQKQKAFKMLYKIDQGKADQLKRSASARGLKLSKVPAKTAPSAPRKSKNVIDRRTKSPVAATSPYSGVTPEKMNNVLKKRKR